MPIKKGKNCFGDVMREYKNGELHSGKKGPVVKSQKQAKAIASSICHSENLRGMGYSEETIEAIIHLLTDET